LNLARDLVSIKDVSGVGCRPIRFGAEK
jgi:hypothetical protein